MNRFRSFEESQREQAKFMLGPTKSFVEWRRTAGDEVLQLVRSAFGGPLASQRRFVAGLELMAGGDRVCAAQNSRINSRKSSAAMGKESKGSGARRESRRAANRLIMGTFSPRSRWQTEASYQNSNPNP